MKKIFGIMIPRKRVEKNSTFLPKVPSTVPHLNETSVAMSYPSVANVFFLADSELE